MTLALVAIVSGMLTVLAPCILPILPVVLGVTALRGPQLLPYVTILSLALSIILFTVLLKVTTLFIIVPPTTWMMLSGLVFILFGLTLARPSIVPRMQIIGHIEAYSSRFLRDRVSHPTYVGAVLIGVALGPIFSTCSPTYFLILASVLPASVTLGILYITLYALGLAVVLLFITWFGRTYLGRLGALADPNGMMKRILGVLFVLLGVGISLGIVSRFELFLLNHLPFDVTLIEHYLIERFIHE
jgi:cytochrome c biogenesis protein CcdA